MEPIIYLKVFDTDRTTLVEWFKSNCATRWSVSAEDRNQTVTVRGTDAAMLVRLSFRTENVNLK